MVIDQIYRINVMIDQHSSLYPTVICANRVSQKWIVLCCRNREGFVASNDSIFQKCFETSPGDRYVGWLTLIVTYRVVLDDHDLFGVDVRYERPNRKLFFQSCRYRSDKRKLTWISVLFDPHFARQTVDNLALLHLCRGGWINKFENIHIKPPNTLGNT